MESEEPTGPAPTPERKRSWLRPAILAVAVAALFVFGIPIIEYELNTVSTDDAYVNSYVTFVAPRVADQVAQVLVDDNNRVKKGDLLVQLDPEPYQVQVAIKEASVATAQANLVAAEATVRSLIGQTRGARFALQNAIEGVDNQVAVIGQRAAKLEQSKANLVLAQAEYNRSAKLVLEKAVSSQDLDEKKAALEEAKAEVDQSLEDVHEARVSLGLPADPPAGGNFTDVPDDIDQNFSSVRQALAELLKDAAQLGIYPSSYDLTPKEVIEDFYRRDPKGDIDRIYAKIMQNAPSLKQAQTALAQAQSDLAQAKLNLSYCQVVSEIDGVVTRRNVNPGDNVQVGQSLMAVRSLRDIWIDANFKETQLRDLRIGQRVKLETDIYGEHHIFEGRISGFTNGTGSTLALLPAQNATGNFVKVVQRLPVRIDVVDYDPDKLPLFVGLSVTPTVDLKSQPTGPNAGKYLQSEIQLDVSSSAPPHPAPATATP
ncbi:MAG TPA: HlyD family secretion protein [Candidatus Methylacidiphilales bacterium]|nr:HlyD family secretion protein [Candidatus Methylacidiphilales bacterium]